MVAMRWVWHRSATKIDKAHAFADGAYESECGYVFYADCDPEEDLGLMLCPKFCKTCSLLTKGQKVRIVSVLDLDPLP